MEKKIYEAPELEVLDMHVEGFFCLSAENVGGEQMGEEEE